MTLPTSKIEAIAGDILTDVFGATDAIELPLNLQRVTDRHNLTIQIGHFEDDAISGAYRKSERTILVSGAEGYQRQSFTIAHELGHFFLHQDLEDDVMLRSEALDPELTNRPQEVEANKFAAALLMPADLIATHWRLRPSLADLAVAFGVSQAAANWRLRNLGLIAD